MLTDRDAQGRPSLDSALRAVVRAIVDANPVALGHVDADHVLFVAGGARRSARASIRPLTMGGHPPVYRRAGWEKPEVWIRGRPALYEICLRPRFFLEADPDQRARIVAHELWHIAPAFDGTLDERRRHRARPAPPDPTGTWVELWRETGAQGNCAFTYRGELRLSAWTDRPPSRLGPAGRRRYTEADLHSAIVEQR